jgi:hypothetical protein
MPYYIIESRNIFNSKMTEKMSTEIVDVLSKYDTTHVCTLDAFDRIFKLTDYNQELSRFNDFLISRFDSSSKSVLFDSLYFA